MKKIIAYLNKKTGIIIIISPMESMNNNLVQLQRIFRSVLQEYSLALLVASNYVIFCIKFPFSYRFFFLL